MAAPYRKLLDAIRIAFPMPVSDRVHDSYFVHSVMRAIDAVDTLKSERPILGECTALDYGAAKKSRLAEEGKSVEKVTQELVEYCEGLTLWGHRAGNKMWCLQLLFPPLSGCCFPRSITPIWPGMNRVIEWRWQKLKW